MRHSVLGLVALLSGCGPLFDLALLPPAQTPDAGAAATASTATTVIEFLVTGEGLRHAGGVRDYPICVLDSSRTFHLSNAAASGGELQLTVSQFDLHRTAPFTDFGAAFIDEPGHFYASGASSHCQLTLGLEPTRARVTGTFTCGSLRDGAGQQAQISTGRFGCCLECR